eukprot:10379753-Alexandrium_andersonii.AAC.1
MQHHKHTVIPALNIDVAKATWRARAARHPRRASCRPSGASRPPRSPAPPPRQARAPSWPP